MNAGMRADSHRSDTEIRDAAELRQQRRLKQTIQFLHKDSADLLPLDGLKKLGTSNEGQPHHILQRRLLEANLSLLSIRGGKPPNNNNNNGVVLSRELLGPAGDEEEEEKEEEEEDTGLIHVPCKCSGQELTVLIDTGCRLNLMSSCSVERLGLKEKVNVNKTEVDVLPFQRKCHTVGYIEKLSLLIGRDVKTECSFSIVVSDKPLVFLGNRTLKSLKCVIDMEKQMLVLGKSLREQVPFASV